MNSVKSAASAAQAPTRPSRARTRVWVPGLLFVDPVGELSTGAHVGFNGRGKSFALGPCGHAASLLEWRHRAWIVRRDDLDDEMVEQHAIILPETLLDPDEQPHARRWLESQPLVCVSGAKVTRLLDAGLRLYTVSYGADEDGVLEVRAEGGERASWSFIAPFDGLLPDALRPDGDAVSQLWQSERREVRSFVDRLLSEVSRGILREEAVVNALQSRTLVEPGYGYRGATHGAAAAVDEVSQRVRALDALFGQVFNRARKHRGEARELANALRKAPPDQKTLDEIPVYGNARRVMLDELVIPLEEDVYERAGEIRTELVLPEEARWEVDRVASWSPRLSDELEEALEQVVGEAGAPPVWLPLLLTGVLVTIIAIGYVMTG